MMTQDPKNKPVIVGDNFDVPPTGVVSVQPVPELIIGPEHALLRPMAESAVLPEFSRAYEADMPTDESTALDDLLGQYPRYSSSGTALIIGSAMHCSCPMD